MPDWDLLLSEIGNSIDSTKMSKKAKKAAASALSAAILAADYARRASNEASI
jgi:hypothetical protein